MVARERYEVTMIFKTWSDQLIKHLGSLLNSGDKAGKSHSLIQNTSQQLFYCKQACQLLWQRVDSAHQTASKWLIPYKVIHGGKVSGAMWHFRMCPYVRGLLAALRDPWGRGIVGSGQWRELLGLATSQQGVHIQGLVKRAQHHVYNGTVWTQTPGYRAVTAIPLPYWLTCNIMRDCSAFWYKEMTCIMSKACLLYQPDLQVLSCLFCIQITLATLYDSIPTFATVHPGIIFQCCCV